jgi:hypothetical protein
MKTKITLLIAVACMISTASFAQAKFGAKAGTNFSNVTDKGAGITSTYVSKTGLNFGLFADFEISDKFSVQPELNFSQMGAKQTDTELGITETTKLNLNYIAIPVLAKVHISDLALMAGPQLSFLTSAKAKTTITGLGSETTDETVDFKGSEFSLILGAEYGFGDKFVLGARYQAGLSDLGKVTVPGFTSKSSAFNLSVGYKFN